MTTQDSKHSTLQETDLLTQVEAVLKARYNAEEDFTASLLPSDAEHDPRKYRHKAARRVDQLTLPDNMRPKMPLTKSKYIVKENPWLVEWEREVRKFLRKLSPEHSHRISAVMIYEWATGLKVAELVAAGSPPQRDMRHLNKILRFYFGKPYTTFIAGHKVRQAYKVKGGYYIKRHRPMSIELWVEYQQGTLNP